MTTQQITDVIKKFQIEGEVLSCGRYGDGHINDTFLIVTTARKYILQRINNMVFKDIDLLMSNIQKVLAHSKKSIIASGGDPERESMTLIPTLKGYSFLKDEDGKFYRVYIFIDNTVSLNMARTQDDFYQSGVAFGKFAGMLDGFDANEIRDVIPNFHNTVVRFDNFINALSADKMNRAVEVKDEIDFVLKHEDTCHRIVDMLKKGTLKWRVTHNDTKLNNVLLDAQTGKAVSVIDLDTVMKGSVCYDFGDSVRFGCSTALEDEEDLNKVHFSLPLFEVYSDGFLGSLDGKLLKAETESMPLGSIMMTLECGIRFLTDYLEGDTYFRVHKDKHNLYRTRTQFRLVEEMERDYDKMMAVVRRYL